MKNLTIVGAGALGSHLAQFIRNEAKITLIDFDRVEAKNVLAQFHSKPQVGKTKVEALKQTLNFLFGVKVDGNTNKLVKDNVEALLKNADLIADCLDNGSSRRLVKAFAADHKIPCVHGAVAPNGEFARVIWNDTFVIDDEPSTGAPTCEGGEHLPFLAMSASYLARAIQTYLKTGKQVGFSISPTTVYAV